MSKDKEFDSLIADLGLEHELEELRKPTDGWDPKPRDFDLGIPQPSDTNDVQSYISKGHIAFRGDFDFKP